MFADKIDKRDMCGILSYSGRCIHRTVGDEESEGKQVSAMLRAGVRVREQTMRREAYWSVHTQTIQQMGEGGP